LLAQQRIKIGDIWFLVTDGVVVDETSGGVNEDGRFAIRADAIDFASQKGLGTKFDGSAYFQRPSPTAL